MAAAALAAALVAGCLSGPRWGYDKPGVGAARYDQDLEGCRREAFRPERFALTPSQRFDEDVIRRCMERKGYRAVPL